MKSMIHPKAGRILAALSAITLLAGPAIAQDEGGEEFVVLETFVVTSDSNQGLLGTKTTASDRTATSIREMPNTVNIVTSEFLETLQPNNLVEALRLAPGVNANRPFTFGNQVEIRGFVINTNLIDGHFDNVNSPGEFIHIDRIEVLNGPASLLYGRTATVGGAINKVTNRPTMLPST